MVRQISFQSKTIEDHFLCSIYDVQPITTTNLSWIFPTVKKFLTLVLNITNTSNSCAGKASFSGFLPD